MRNLALISIFGCCLLVVGMYGESHAATEKGSKKCSDGVDNDGDGLIDASDPDCTTGDGSGGGGTTEDPVATTMTIDTNVDEASSTIGPFDAVVECGTSFCEFDAHVNSDSDVFYLPPSIAGADGIIDSTSWHKTPLDAELCYDVDKLGEPDPDLKLVDVYHIFMRVYDDPSEGWDLYVSGWACDMDSDASYCDRRQYEQRFRGQCPADGCPELPPSADASEYVGAYLNTFSSGPDSKLGIPCRCTMSNDPDCPLGVVSEEDLPPITVTVTAQ